jgi:hypothetical protein
MSIPKELPIKFKLQRIETIQYAVLTKSLVHTNLKFSADFKYAISEGDRLVTCLFKYILQSEDKQLLVIEVAIDFVIEPISFKKLYSKDKELVLPKLTAIHFALISVGTTRGILHEKTKDTIFNQYPIPTINLQKRILADVKFQ